MLDPLIRTVSDMMQRFGGDATLEVDMGSVYDPETSTNVQDIRSFPIRIVAQDYIQRGSGMMNQAGGLIQTGDKQFFIKPAPPIPAPRPGVDSIIFAGRKWAIHTVKEHNPSGTNVYLYEVYARQ